MQRRAFLQTAGAAALPAVGAAARPNILIITTDQHSADAMSCRTGTRSLRTPHFDSLAANGLMYARAYCANPLCVPSRTSLYTGRYPVETGVQTNDRAEINPARFPNMGSIFRSAGYATAYFGKWHLPFPEKAVETYGWKVFARGKAEGDAGTAGGACAYLRGKYETPFLLAASLVNPHNICQWARDEELPEGRFGKPPALVVCPPLRANTGPQRWN